MVTRTVLISIPEIVEEYVYAKAEENTEACQEVKERLELFYSGCREELKVQINKYVCKFLEDSGLDNEKDLDGLFGNVLH